MKKFLTYNLIALIYAVLAVTFMILSTPGLNIPFMLLLISLSVITSGLGLGIYYKKLKLSIVYLILSILNLCLCLVIGFLVNVGIAVVFRIMTFIPSILQVLAAVKLMSQE